jgi:hypothetical protein
MAGELLFPSQEWFRTAAARLHADTTVQAAARDFGPVTVGLVIEKGDGLQSDFCVFGELHPGREPKLQFPDDEDELDDLEPAYLVVAPHAVCRRVLEAALLGQRQDPLAPVLNREVKLRGDLPRLVRFAGQHKGAGAGALLSLPTRTLR